MDQELRTYLDDQKAYLEAKFERLEKRVDALTEGQARLREERREDLNRQTQLLLESFQSKVEAVAEGHDVIRSELARKIEKVQGRRRDDLAALGTTLAALQERG